MQLPPCGLYRTTGQIGTVESGRLVYFHNHGKPGPGIYLPNGWKQNRAQFADQGITIPGPESVRFLEPLRPEGFYRVKSEFVCCERKCRTYEPDALVQLGYDGTGQAILFVPELLDGMLAIPERGTRIDASTFTYLQHLKVPLGQRPELAT